MLSIISSMYSSRGMSSAVMMSRMVTAASMLIQAACRHGVQIASGSEQQGMICHLSKHLPLGNNISNSCWIADCCGSLPVPTAPQCPQKNAGAVPSVPCDPAPEAAGLALCRGIFQSTWRARAQCAKPCVLIVAFQSQPIHRSWKGYWAALAIDSSWAGYWCLVAVCWSGSGTVTELGRLEWSCSRKECACESSRGPTDAGHMSLNLVLRHWTRSCAIALWRLSFDSLAAFQWSCAISLWRLSFDLAAFQWSCAISLWCLSFDLLICYQTLDAEWLWCAR